MSDVLEFRKPGPKLPDTIEYTFSMEVTQDGDLDALHCHEQNLTIEDKVLIAHLMFTAAWWMGRDISGKYDDNRDLLCQVAIHRGGGLRVFSPGNDHKDSFQNEEHIQWLMRQFHRAFKMALPSWLEEQPASGMTSSSHSANIDQLEFSW